LLIGAWKYFLLSKCQGWQISNFKLGPSQKFNGHVEATNDCNLLISHRKHRLGVVTSKENRDIRDDEQQEEFDVKNKEQSC
jgi:hypothetical protein